MSKRNQTRKRNRRTKYPRCQVCGAAGRPCYEMDHYSSARALTVHGKFTGVVAMFARDPDEILCSEHANKRGYCRGCGEFWAGTNGFDFIHPGLCEFCDRDNRDNDDALDDEGDWEL